MLKVGKRVLEVVCPLCDTIYLLNGNEAKCEEIVEENEEHGNKPPHYKYTFYCPDCNRYVIDSERGRLSILRMGRPEEFNPYKDFVYDNK